MERFLMCCVRMCVAMTALFFSLNVSSQNLFFSTLSTKDGLPSNIISGIAQDDNDFIWIGTGNGVTRYDGSHFRTFKKNESSKSLPSNEVSCILADGNFIWVGTWNGLCKINTINFEVTRIDLSKNVSVRSLYHTSDFVWIGTEDGLIQYDKHKNKIAQRYDAKNYGLSHNTVRSIFIGTDETIWVGTYDKLNRLAPGKSKFEVFDLKGGYKSELKNNLISGEIRTSINDPATLWIGTETGLVQFNTVSLTFRQFNEKNSDFSNEVIKCTYQDGEGNVWLGTDFGINIFNPVTKANRQYFHNPQSPYSIANNVVWQIFEDHGGVIWIVTSNGLSRLNKSHNNFEYHEVANQIEGQKVGNQVKSVFV